VSFEEGNPRSQGALAALVELVQRVASGEMVLMDFFINKSTIDPLRMSIDIKTARGPGSPPPGAEAAIRAGVEAANTRVDDGGVTPAATATNVASATGGFVDPPVRYAQPDPRAPPPNKSARRRARINDIWRKLRGDGLLPPKDRIAIEAEMVRLQCEDYDETGQLPDDKGGYTDQSGYQYDRFGNKMPFGSSPPAEQPPKSPKPPAPPKPPRPVIDRSKGARELDLD
jgi:hypothetical protein